MGRNIFEAGVSTNISLNKCVFVRWISYSNLERPKFFSFSAGRSSGHELAKFEL